MKKLIFTAVSMLSIQNVMAGEWLQRLSCDGSSLVVDGYHSFAAGYTANQLVIRDPKIVSYFDGLASQGLHLNASNELVAPLNGVFFNGNFEVIVADIKTSATASSGKIYKLTGQWVNPSQYEVYMTSLYHVAGGTNATGTYVGKWVFNNCKTLNK